MAEAVEELHLLLAVSPSGMLGGEALDQLADARAELVGEMRRRRPDEPVDLLDCRVAHGLKPRGSIL
jgi:hypothetical protein